MKALIVMVCFGFIYTQFVNIFYGIYNNLLVGMTGSLDAVVPEYKNLGLNFIPKDGMNVIVKGKVSVFTTGGSYQITVSNMKEDGIGNLYILFEELKRRLEREGLFSPEHKKKLPRIPKKVGVITASTGAAVKDIISTINRRFPLTEIILFPTLVQGVGAKENIVKMINEANESDVDVIILGRGGGSIEDLWAFNEEIVARAIYNSTKPIVSAVGHEIDFTISDFVSDMRAPTPTGAAELVVPSKVEIQSYLNDYKGRIISVINKKIKSYTDTFSKLKSTYILKNPISMYEIDEQKLDNMLEKLGSIMTYKLEREKSELNNLSKMISPNMLNRLDKEKIKLENIETKLNLLNPENILKKGYSLTLVEGKIVKSINSVKKGSIIDTKFSDGIIKSEVL